MKQYTFVIQIKFDDPENQYTTKQVREYIHDAVSSWSGQFHPNDAIFGIRDEQVIVKGYRKPNVRHT